MSDIFREVDEALQQDKMLAIWNEYKNTIIAAIIIVLVTSTATSMYKNWDTKRNVAETQRLLSALDAEDPQAAIQDVVKDTRKNHKAIGLMSAAHLNLKNGNKEEAAKLYQQVAEDKKSPRNLRDLARILFVQNTDTPDIKTLQPLLSNDKSPWVWHARLEAAALTAHDKADYQGALYYLKKFETDRAQYVPTTLKQRAKALSHVYSLKVKMEEKAKIQTSADGE
jgi:hypothetical protein